MENNRWSYILTISSTFFSFIPLIVSFINIKYIRNFSIFYFILIIVSIGVDGLNTIFAISGDSNTYMFHYYTIAEFTLISLFYSFFFKQYFNPIIINLIIPIFLIAAYMDYKINGLDTMNNYSSSLEAIILSFYSFFFFYYVLKNLVFEDLLATPVFWLNTAVLFYFAGNFILFIFSNYMAKSDPRKYMLLWSIIHTFFNVLYNALLSIGFWKARTK